MTTHPWWQGAVIYQIYPRSLLDSNADGVGDLPGITHKLNYIASLGVDAIWISPFFRSPMNDFGYDISDYRAVDPLFGSLADFDQLLETAHEKDIKVLIDQVLSHTSDQHPWFQESRQDRDNPKADWYVWADPKPDGTPPNNWLAVFGGQAWKWEPRRGQYYLHNFLTSQPDLNFHNPQVRAQMLDEVAFWLDRGVDGMRLDVVNFYFHDARLRDNPPKPPQERRREGAIADNPYAFQHHCYDPSQPENLDFLRELRRLVDRYPGRVTLGEVGGEDSLDTMAQYISGDSRLHMAYSFDLLTDGFSTRQVQSTVEALEGQLAEGWPCWSTGNHDVPRVMSRWGGDQKPDALAKLFNALLLSLRGCVCNYQGEELGLTEAAISREELQDPFGIAFWPRFKGRDGCRTPIPWQAEAPNAGFTQAGTPWLPIPEEHRSRAVDRQEARPDSVLNAYRRFLHWRQAQPALRRGGIEFLSAPEGQLLFVREHPDQRLLVALNFTGQTVQLELPSLNPGQPLEEPGLPVGRLKDQHLELPAYGAYYAPLGRSPGMGG